jgi:2,3-bisphosphoglycerate-independent phosphoglycerate mutase
MPMLTTSPTLLIILDGWGYRETSAQNAIAQANTPVWNNLWATCPHTLISGSGLDVGLPAGQMGNSEVGHMTLGSGRVIYQDLTLINNAIADESFYNNKILLQALATAKQNNKTIHVLGLVSPGGVHSHEQQIFAMLKMAAQQQAPKVCVHAFLDGRDTPPQSAKDSILALEKICAQQKNTSIATVMGRFYAMDRDKRTERTDAAINLLINGQAKYKANSALVALEDAYARGETDEFVQPTQITNDTIKANDVVVFMNFRADRARQLSYALLKTVQLGDFVTLTEYDKQLPAKVAFPKLAIKNVLGEVFQQHHVSQLRIAETEKYAHVTFFFNAGREEPFVGEDRVLIPSPKVTTYDLQPAMSAKEITAKLLSFIEAKAYEVIICNFANADMVGHTGKMTEAIQAIEVLDSCLGNIVAALKQFGGQALITADHGNAEIMWDEKSNQPHTAHTSNLVPLVYVGNNKIKFKSNLQNTNYGLKDVAPTVLKLLNIEPPPEMIGISLLDDTP